MKASKTIGIIAATLTLVATVGYLATAGDGHKKHSSTETSVASIGKAAPGFTLMDATGKKHNLSDYRGKYVVLEWINFGCPFVLKHYNSGNMQMLQAKFVTKDVVWLSICSSAPGKQGWFDEEALLSRIKKAHTHASAYLVDADGAVGRAYKAKTTPNMYIINPKGVLIYSGAIDDKPSTNPDDIKGSVNYVDAALISVLAGREIAVSKSVPYGCSVKY